MKGMSIRLVWMNVAKADYSSLIRIPMTNDDLSLVLMSRQHLLYLVCILNLSNLKILFLIPFKNNTPFFYFNSLDSDLWKEIKSVPCQLLCIRYLFKANSVINLCFEGKHRCWILNRNISQSK